MYRAGNGGIMGQQPIGGSFVIIGTDYQQGVGTGFLRGFAQGNGVGCVIGAGARNDLAGIAHIPFPSAEQFQLFKVGQGRGFPCGAAEHNGFDSSLNLPPHQQIHHGVVDISAQKRCNEGGAYACEQWLFHRLIPPAQSMRADRILPAGKSIDIWGKKG